MIAGENPALYCTLTVHLSSCRYSKKKTEAKAHDEPEYNSVMLGFGSGSSIGDSASIVEYI